MTSTTPRTPTSPPPYYGRGDLPAVADAYARVDGFAAFVLDRFAAYTRTGRARDNQGRPVAPVTDPTARTSSGYGHWRVSASAVRALATTDGDTGKDPVTHVRVEHYLADDRDRGSIAQVVMVPVEFVFNETPEADPEADPEYQEYLRLQARFAPQDTDHNHETPLDPVEVEAHQALADMAARGARALLRMAGQPATPDAIADVVDNPARARTLYRHSARLVGATNDAAAMESLRLAAFWVGLGDPAEAEQAEAEQAGVGTMDEGGDTDDRDQRATARRNSAARTLLREADRPGTDAAVARVLTDPAFAAEVYAWALTRTDNLLRAHRAYDPVKHHGHLHYLHAAAEDLGLTVNTTPRTAPEPGTGDASVEERRVAAARTLLRQANRVSTDTKIAHLLAYPALATDTFIEALVQLDSVRPTSNTASTRKQVYAAAATLGLTLDTAPRTTPESGTEDTKAPSPYDDPRAGREHTTPGQANTKDQEATGLGYALLGDLTSRLLGGPEPRTLDAASAAYEKARAVLTLSGKDIFGTHTDQVVAVVDDVADLLGLNKPKGR